MDLTLLVTISASVLANIGTVIGLFMWATNHAASDNKETRSSIQRNREETQAMIERSSNETKAMISAIQQEMKDFHTRLLEIEIGRKMESRQPLFSRNTE